MLRNFVTIRRPDREIEIDYDWGGPDGPHELYPPDDVILTDKERIETEELILDTEAERDWEWRQNA